MTEAEWLTTDDPEAILECGRLRTHDRKLRLFGLHCCREFQELLNEDRRLMQIVDAAEDFVEGRLRESDRHEAELWADEVLDELDYDDRDAYHLLIPVGLLRKAYTPLDARLALEFTWMIEHSTLPESGFSGQSEEVRAELASVLRDLFGNPFRPVTFDPRWRTATALALAQRIYEQRAFDGLPILADALEDVGCEHFDILNHCREPGPHVRGCWVVDLVLGKQ